MVCCGGLRPSCLRVSFLPQNAISTTHAVSLSQTALPQSLSTESLDQTPGAVAFTTQLKLCVKVSEFHVAKSIA